MTDGKEIDDPYLVEADDGQGIEIEVDVESPTMSRELTEFLIQLSITVHRFGMYPPGHPALQPAADGVLDRLPRLLKRRRRQRTAVRLAARSCEGAESLARRLQRLCPLAKDEPCQRMP